MKKSGRSLYNQFYHFFPNLKEAKGRWPQEILAGLLVGIIALPLALAFGVSAFEPLGPGMGALGAVAGITGAALAGFFASLAGGCAPLVSGPTGPMSVVARSTLATLVALPALANLPEDLRVPLVILLFGASVALGGLLQALLAWTKLGNLVRALPYPVVAGFMNGVSLLILLGQIRPFLGWPSATPWEELFSFPWPAPVMVGALAGLSTAGVIVILPKLTKKIPASFVGLLVGTGVYYLLTALWNPVGLDLTTNAALIGTIPSSLPLPVVITQAPTWLPWILSPTVAGILVQQAVVLALLGSIDTLLTAVISDLRTGTRHNSSRELMGQGLGNFLAGLFGALPGAGATVRTLVNIDNGGRSGLSGMVHALFLLGVLLVLGPLAQGIPLPVLGGILVVMAVKMIDVWSLELLRKKSARGDSLVLWLVTGVTIAVDLIVAVGVGLVVAAFLYVRKQTILGSQIEVSDLKHQRSRVLRNRREEELLLKAAPQARVVSVRGSLFFGSSDEQMGRLEELGQGSRLFILDLSSLETLDLTGAKMLVDLASRQKKQGLQLFWGGIRPGSPAQAYLQDMGLGEVLPESQLFPTLDEALEAGEAFLLQKDLPEKTQLELEDLDFWSRLEPEDQEALASLVEWKELEGGQTLFATGDQGGDLYFVMRGEVEVRDRQRGRLAVYSPGQPLGLLSWIDGVPKSYTAQTTRSTLLAWLPGGPLEELLQARPALGFHLLRGWAGQLTTRLRRLQRATDWS